MVQTLPIDPTPPKPAFTALWSNPNLLTKPACRWGLYPSFCAVTLLPM
jgi:hypothetical protein